MHLLDQPPDYDGVPFYDEHIDMNDEMHMLSVTVEALQWHNSVTICTEHVTQKTGVEDADGLLHDREHAEGAALDRRRGHPVSGQGRRHVQQELQRSQRC